MKAQPILESDLVGVGEFLNANLSSRFSPQTWADSLRYRWAAQVPNHGSQLITDEGRRVGVLLAVYSDQMIDGRLERFCNPHSWCVLDEYRHASLDLVLSVVRQRDYHFTMFTPNPKVAKVFLGLRFRELDDGLLFFPNLPRPWPQGGGRFVETQPERIAARLEGAVLADFEAHRSIPWLEFVAFGVPGDVCLAIYKRRRWKRMACAFIGHLSDRGAFARHGHLLRAHLLGRGMPVSRLEARFAEAPPPLAWRTQRGQPKLVSSRTLKDHQVRDTYSELMALDL